MQYIELLDATWMEKIERKNEISFVLNGIGIDDSREKLELILDQQHIKYEITQPVLEVNKEQYTCEGFKYNVIVDLVVGLGINRLQVERDYIEKHLGMPDSVEPIIELICLMDWVQTIGYIWLYKDLNLAITFDSKQAFAETFHFGYKLSVSDDY